jgi:hypothetical protein
VVGTYAAHLAAGAGIAGDNPDRHTCAVGHDCACADSYGHTQANTHGHAHGLSCGDCNARAYAGPDAQTDAQTDAPTNP